MSDERQPPNLGNFTPAQPSPRFLMTCARCSGKHDGTGAKRWIKGTKLMMCAACAEAREILRMERIAA
jgi:hypothetical protein